ncbi:Negative regulator of mitotic exit, partial [Nowakowskiella sp. JEL0078]
MAGWKLNINNYLPKLVNSIAIPVNSGKEIYLIFGMRIWNGFLFNEDYAIASYDPILGGIVKIKTVPLVGVGTTNSPDFRASHSAAIDIVNNKIFSFGGYEKSGKLSKDLWVLNLVNKSWQVVLDNGSDKVHPVPVLTWSVVAGSYFVTCFGSMGGSSVPINACSLFSISSNVWISTVDSDSLKPPPRSSTRMVFVPPSKIVMFGGADRSTGVVYNDVWTLDVTKLPTIVWTQIYTHGTNNPSPRQEHSMDLVPSSSVILIWGGKNGTLEQDPWDANIYALDTSTWHWLSLWNGLSIPVNPNTKDTATSLTSTNIIAGMSWIEVSQSTKSPNLQTNILNLNLTADMHDSDDLGTKLAIALPLAGLGVLSIIGVYFFMRRRNSKLSENVKQITHSSSTDHLLNDFRKISSVIQLNRVNRKSLKLETGLEALETITKALAVNGHAPKANNELWVLPGDEMIIIEEYAN